MPAAVARRITMTQELIELTDQQLAHVSGGFLGLLGLITAGAGLAGQIMDGIGKKKAQEAQQIVNDANAAAGQGTAPSPTGGSGNLLGQPAPVAPSGG